MPENPGAQHLTAVSTESPLAQLHRHAKMIERASSLISAIETTTPVDMAMAKRALFDVEQAIRRAHRAIAAARTAALVPRRG